MNQKGFWSVKFLCPPWGEGVWKKMREVSGVGDTRAGLGKLKNENARRNWKYRTKSDP